MVGLSLLCPRRLCLGSWSCPCVAMGDHVSKSARVSDYVRGVQRCPRTIARLLPLCWQVFPEKTKAVSELHSSERGPGCVGVSMVVHRVGRRSGSTTTTKQRSCDRFPWSRSCISPLPKIHLGADSQNRGFASWDTVATACVASSLPPSCHAGFSMWDFGIMASCLNDLQHSVSQVPRNHGNITCKHPLPGEATAAALAEGAKKRKTKEYCTQLLTKTCLYKQPFSIHDILKFGVHTMHT